MIKIWIKHKILEYCIEVFFREFYKNFIFPQIIPAMYLTFDADSITVQDDKHSMSLEIEGLRSSPHNQDEITNLVMSFLKKHHNKIYHRITGSTIAGDLKACGDAPP